MKYYLEFKDALSNKFWYITQQDESLTIVFGKIGAKGQTQVKTFSSPADAEKEANKLIRSKINQKPNVFMILLLKMMFFVKLTPL